MFDLPDMQSCVASQRLGDASAIRLRSFLATIVSGIWHNSSSGSPRLLSQEHEQLSGVLLHMA